MSKFIEIFVKEFRKVTDLNSDWPDETSVLWGTLEIPLSLHTKKEHEMMLITKIH